MSGFDLVVLVLLGFGAVTGFQKGLITGAARLAGKIAAIVIALLFHQQFISLIEPVFDLEAMIEPKVEGFLAKIAESTAISGSSGEGSLLQPMLTEATIAVTDYVLTICGLLLLFIAVSVIINIIITIVITPLARSLSLVNRGGGLAFGLLSTFIVLSLVIGLTSPFINTTDTGIISTGESFIYPILLTGYDSILAVISVFDSEILTNPFEAFPLLKGTPV